ncbi:adenosylmethionine--8-amino-7-oxononanoate transaminase [Thermovibrio ammonificans]|uniref:Adenosylmethionine-8-amino-7-oxononanoate aminotransferase n=1 Tax=Thermovibrio ammonificans (strain DSM 15698 / JCM 12110 / HB-1) TaxID=648996 RepID=E8T452_THEA1|nr:adenosylmethionine--8-amino-7-oxononanoate transaminase [Thermovibrio ammonificans]ADU97381.1 adenosylmethionine-8-amino-7-oxononanoate aminotransferase [Thermovibrio ammonificans HB-1]
MESRLLKEWDKTFVWHPFTQMAEYVKHEPIVIERGEGCWLIDTDGKRYLDAVGSIWCNVHGHNVKELNEALIEQVNKIAHSTLLGLANVPSILLAKAVVELAPEGLNHVFYTDDGSTAMEAALKMAYQYWQLKGEKRRTKFIKLEEAYHGDTIGSVSIGGIELFHSMFKELMFETFKIPAPHPYRFNGTAEECRDYSLSKLEEILKERGEEVAAVVMEPLVQAAAGIIAHPEGFLKGVRELCDKYGTLLILDEVATGFGKTGKWFACQHEGVVPDIMAISKGLTAGYMPLAITLATDEVYGAFWGGDYGSGKTFFHGHTFTGNQLGCAVALRNIELFKEKGWPERLGPKIEYLWRRLREELADLKHVGDIRGRGFMVGIELVKDKRTKEGFSWRDDVGRRVSRRIIEKGVFTRPLGPVLVVMPPLAISEEEIDFMVKAYKEAIVEVLGG